MNSHSYTIIVKEKIMGCEIENCIYHSGKYNKVLPTEIEYDALSNLYKVMGDKTRLKIVFCLFEKACCVQEISHMLNLSQSLISHQLIVLKQNKIVSNRREKNRIYYSLADNHIKLLLGLAREHIDEL